MKIHRIILTFLITSLVLVIGILPVVAEDEPGIQLYNAALVTNDLHATYIEGEVPVADGQEIVVTHGILTIARKALPTTGQPAKFRIKIPASELNEDKVTALRVRATEGENVAASLPVRAEVTYKAKEEQDIKTGSEEYTLTMPGLSEAIDAEATSDSNLYYISNDPKVVDVDDDGNLVPIGKGETEVTVRTLGDGRYNGTEKSVSVKVDEIDAYSVTFHSSIDDGDETSVQIIERGGAKALDANSFDNGEHQFLGWATEEGGLVQYTNSETVQDIAEKGGNTDLYAVWTGDGARAAVAWAINIANDNSFSYGKKPQTSKVGCYFCGTNQRNKPKGYEKTYVCLTFVEAAYAHGTEDPELLAECRAGKKCISANNSNFSRYSCWKKVGLAKNLSINDLQPGDVICWYTANGYSNGHVAMYAGNNQIVDAEGIKDCWGANSIAVRGNAAAKLRSAGRFNSNSYVMRYVGPNA